MGFVLRLLRLGIFVLMPGGQEVQVYMESPNISRNTSSWKCWKFFQNSAWLHATQNTKKPPAKYVWDRSLSRLSCLTDCALWKAAVFLRSPRICGQDLGNMWKFRLGDRCILTGCFHDFNGILQGFCWIFSQWIPTLHSISRQTSNFHRWKTNVQV